MKLVNNVNYHIFYDDNSKYYNAKYYNVWYKYNSRAYLWIICLLYCFAIISLFFHVLFVFRLRQVLCENRQENTKTYVKRYLYFDLSLLTLKKKCKCLLTSK